MRHLKLLPLILAAALAAGSAWSTTPPPAATEAAPKDVAPDPHESLVDEAVAGLLQNYHYARRPLDGALSQEIFNRYLQDLDPNRSYFTQSDIDAFAPDRLKLDDSIRDGDMNPAFAIFNVFQKRVNQRLQYALQFLDHEPDLTVKEDYVFDRSKAPWAKDQDELNNLWRKRLKNDVIGLLLAGKTWPQTQDTLRKRYQNFDYRTRQVTSEDVFSVFMNAYAHSMDPHTDYFSPVQSQEFEMQMSLKLQGIGASLVQDGEYTRVDHLLPGGPAARDPLKQLHPDDRITGIGQGDHGDIVDVVGWRLDDVVALIRGTPGTTVRLEVLPAGAAPGSAEKTIQYTRDTIKLEAQAAHQKVISVTRDKKTYKIGIITVPGFYEDQQARILGEKDYTSTTHDVHKLLTELQSQHVDGVVIDLRNNGGGSLKEAEDMTGLFIPSGPVVQIRHPDGRIDVEGDDDGSVAYAGPLAVLVNRATASASEIFAAAIQDYHRGLVIGSTTYGKGTVQILLDLSRDVPGDDNAGQLKLTEDKFYRVTGSSTQTKGVNPDIALPALVDPVEFGESANDSALPWDEIKPAQFSALQAGLDKALPKLSEEHAARAAKDPDWKLFMDGVQQFEAERAQTSVSLVLADREKQRAEDDAKRLAVANGWRRLKGLPPAASLEDALKLPKGDDPAAAESDAEALQPDVLLDESAAIVADMDAAGLFQGPPNSALAQSH
ncbi:MAG TPA: carboxy terminal-processing peptidase [Gammaproteobacteria bacterium]|nr:carboxy terminal-processing peptidase [Gammaproteobacteria bacterium]